MRMKHMGRGYSLLEALIVVVLIGAISIIALPTLARTLQVYRIQTAAQQIATNIRFARSAAIKQKVAFRVGFDASGNTYQVHYRKGGGPFETYLHADTSLPDDIDILSVTLTGGATRVEFGATGTPSASGTVTLKGTDLSQWEVRLSTVGGVSLVKTVEGVY